MSGIICRTLRAGVARKPLFLAHQSGSATAAVAEDSTAAARPFEEIPGYRSLPFVGTSWVFYPIVGKFKHEEAHLYDLDKHSRFGGICRDVFAGTTLVSVCNEEDFEALLRQEGKTPFRGFILTMLKYRKMRSEWFKSIGVMLTQGQEWYNLRVKFQRHLMKPRSVDRYLDPITDVTHDLIKRIVQIRDDNNDVADVMNELFKWSLESVGYIGLETRLGCLDANAPPDSEGRRMIQAVQTTFDCVNRMEAITGSSVQLWKYFPTPSWKKMVKAMDFFTETSLKHVQESVNALKTKSPEEGGLTVLQEMLASGDIEPHEAMTMVNDMLMAGIDTTSNTTGYLLYHLAKNPEKQEKLYENIRRHMPTPSDRLTPEILSEMRYLKACLKEAIRLTPVARGLMRVTEKDMVLSGYRVPPGTVVLLMLQIAGRNEEYFKDANSFVPERWMERNSKPSPFVYFPFGFGTRSCLGRRIAEMEIWTLTTEIIRRFKVEYHQEDFQMTNRLVNVPDRPLKFKFIDRE